LLIVLAVLSLAAVTVLSLSMLGPAYTVVSDSMVPALSPGDLLWLKPVVGPVSTGMIVSYEHEDQLVTHRVVGIEGDRLVTKGDNNSGVDTWRVHVSDVVGTPAVRVPHLGALMGYLRRPVAWVLLVAMPACILVAAQVRQILAALDSRERHGSKE
jgi:signal peptidase